MADLMYIYIVSSKSGEQLQNIMWVIGGIPEVTDGLRSGAK